MATANRKDSNKEASINFRATREEKDLIARAAKASGQRPTVYARKSLVLKAEIDLASKNEFAVSTKKMEAFLAALDKPVQNKPKLKKLLTEKSILD